MADRKQFIAIAEADVELLRLLKDSENVAVTDEQLREQRISFAFGNALNLGSITMKASAHFSTRPPTGVMPSRTCFGRLSLSYVS